MVADPVWRVEPLLRPWTFVDLAMSERGCESCLGYYKPVERMERMEGQKSNGKRADRGVLSLPS